MINKAPNNQPLLVPVNIGIAVVAMWTSLAISAAFTIFDVIYGEANIDTTFAFAIFAVMVFIIKQIVLKRTWARMVYVLLTVLSYALIAVDADGITRLDFWQMLLTAPIDVLVISRLFSNSANIWFADK